MKLIYVRGALPHEPCKGLTNTERLIFKIKSYAEEEDMVRFNDKAELAIQKPFFKKNFLALPKKNLKKALITREKSSSVVKLCDKFGILVGGHGELVNSAEHRSHAWRF